MPRPQPLLLHPGAAAAIALLLSGCGGGGEPPGLPELAFTLESARTTDDLRVEVTNAEADVTYAYAWTRGGQAVTDLATDTVPSDRTAKGQTWEVAVTPTRGRAIGATARASIQVVNTPPVVSASWVNDDPSGDDDLEVVATAADEDGDNVALRYAWAADGVGVSVSSERVSHIRTRRGQVWTVQVSANDGEVDGEPLTLTVTVRNSRPELLRVDVSPDSPFTSDTIVASPLGAYDQDEDPVTVSFDWYVDGAVVQSGPVASLGPDLFVKGQRVWVVATPNDGIDDGDPVTSPELLVVNSPPGAPAKPVITPVSPQEHEALTCAIPAPASDADGDALEYEISWFKGGVFHSRSVGSALAAVLPASSTTLRDSWTCSARATDTDGATGPDSELSAAAVVRGLRDGQVRKVDGTWVDVDFIACGSGTTGCTASAAKTACTSRGMKVVSHASDGTSSVYSLGASSSCNFSISYYVLETTLASGSCLVGVSNLDWSSCCGTSSWHGNTVNFGAVSSTFGYVASSNSGYVSSYANVSGRTWGCQSTASAAAAHSGCTQHYVACTPS